MFLLIDENDSKHQITNQLKLFSFNQLLLFKTGKNL